MDATNVLVVDDSHLIVKLIVKLLLQNGIKGYYFDEDHIHIAGDGMEAYDILGSHPEITLIISDVNMPNLNGDELLDILIDTNKISTMEVVLITGKEIAEQLSYSTKKNILGVIHKPFNKESFPAHFNELLERKEQNLNDMVLIQKENQAKKEFSSEVIHNYLTLKDIAVNEEVLEAALEGQFSYDTRVLDEDLLTILRIALEEYNALTETEKPIDAELLKKCHKKLSAPDKAFDIKNPLELKKGFQKALEKVKYQVAGQSKDQLNPKETLVAIFKELETKIYQLFTRVNRNKKLQPQLFQPQFDLVVEVLTQYDEDIIDYEVQKMFAEYEELIAFHGWIKNFYQTMKIFSTIPELKSSKPLADESNKKLQTIFKYSSATLLHYTGAIEKMLWHRAKTSASVMKFIRKAMPNQIPNTKALLIYLQKISKAEIKEYEAFEHENVMIISSFLATLQEVKSKQEENFRLWHMVGFSKSSLVESWLESNIPTKIVLDYDFTTPVFKNGLQYLFHLAKKYPDIAQAFKDDSLFILASNAKVVEIRENKQDLEFTLISKPLKTMEIKNALMYS